MVSVTWGSLGVALAINSIICAVAVLAFNILRRYKHSRKYFGAKRLLKIPFRYRPKRLSTSFFSWWTPLLSYSDEEVYACAGMDALTYIRYLRLGLKLSIAVGFVSFAMVLPTNWAGGTVVDDRMKEQEAMGITDPAMPTASDAADGEGPDYVYSSFDKTSMANVPDQSNLLWVHLIAIYIISFIVMKLLWSAHKEAVSWRIRYLASTRKGAESHTVMVHDIPGTPYGTLYGRLYEHFDGTIGKLIPRGLRTKIEAAVTNGTVAASAGLSKSGVAAVLGTDLPSKDPVRENIYLSAQERDRSISGAAGKAVAESSDAGDSALIDGPQHSPGHKPRGRATAGTGYDNPLASLPAAEQSVELARMGSSARRRSIGGCGQPLSEYEPEAAATDFNTWAHAQAAVRRGLSLEQLVKREFERSYPAASVSSVTMVKENAELGAALDKYKKARMKLEDFIDSWSTALRRNKPIKSKQTRIVPLLLGAAATQKYGRAPVKVDPAEFLPWHARECLSDVLKAQEAARKQDTCAAFVTFTTRLTQSQAVTSLHYHDEAYWKLSPAPGPLEVLWENTSHRGWERSLRSVFTWGLFVFMMLTFMIPVTLVQGMMSIEQLDSWPGVDWILAQPVVRGIVQSILPGLALTIFLALVPMIIKFFNGIQGVYSKSSMDFELGRKYFVFQFLIVFVVGVVGGTLLTSAEEAADDFEQWLKDLGGQIPRTATFFLTFTLVKALISLPVSLLRVPGLVIFIILSKLSGSERAKRRLWAQQYLAYGSDVPDHSLTIVYLLVFSIQQPFICVACFLYFVFALFKSRYQLLYVFREGYQSGGRFWPIMYQQVIVALFTFQIIMAVLLLLQRFVYMPLAIIPIIVSVVFHRAAQAKFDRPLDNLSVHAAADLDRADSRVQKLRASLTREEEQQLLETMDCENVAFGPPEELYIAPGFKLKADDLDDVLLELEHGKERVRMREAGHMPEAVLEDPDEDDDDEDGVAAATGAESPAERLSKRRGGRSEGTRTPVGEAAV